MCDEMPTDPGGQSGIYCSHDWISDLDCFHYLYCYMDYNIVNVGNEREGDLNSQVIPTVFKFQPFYLRNCQSKSRSA